MTDPTADTSAIEARVSSSCREAAELAMVDNARLTAALGEAPLFVPGDFVAHSGATLRWKVECDALTPEDWQGLALAAVEYLPAFGAVEGIPRGGLPFAEALAAHVTTGPLLIADDVCTTGASMEEHRGGRDAIGVVAFARGPVPSWVTPVFATPGVWRAAEADAATGRAVGRRYREGWVGNLTYNRWRRVTGPVSHGAIAEESMTKAGAAWLASLNDGEGT